MVDVCHMKRSHHHLDGDRQNTLPSRLFVCQRALCSALVHKQAKADKVYVYKYSVLGVM